MNSRQYPLPLPHQPRFQAQDFMRAGSNLLAWDFLHQWPNWPAHPLGNLCVLSGPSGSGKTHLAHIFAAHSGGHYQKLPAKDLSQTPLILDDLSAILGNREAETQLFHLCNRIKEQKETLLITAAGAPAHLNFCLPDLASRLRGAAQLSLQAPDDALLGALLLKAFNDRQVLVNDELLSYLLPRIERSAEAALTMVEKLDKAALAASRPINIALARQLLDTP